MGTRKGVEKARLPFSLSDISSYGHPSDPYQFFIIAKIGFNPKLFCF